MKDLIQLLPDSVANQIAAGEVIQRPASVIKELVENAIDAGAKSVKVVIVDAGRTLIQVIDDGCGMSETDARLAFERHATSKIRKADDLFSLHTMGFRGEALPSIAAVAQVELLTRTADDELGTRLRIAGSRVVSQEPASCPVGSNFRVENLFYNVPARRKFLKSNATELSNILTAFERIVLVYPHVAFTLHHNNQELLNLRADATPHHPSPTTHHPSPTIHHPSSTTHHLTRIDALFGHQLSASLLPVSVETTLCRITGFVGKPEAARKKTSHEYFFVNGRYMRHPYFHKAVAEAYERLVPEGSRVPYFIYIDVDPATIDVNIHPTKTEIKFENEQSIWQILSAAVKDAIGRFCEVPAIDFDTVGRPDIPVFDPQRDRIDMPKVQYNTNYNPFSPTTHHTQASQPSQQLDLYDALLTDASAAPAPSPLLSDLSPTHYQYKGRYIMTAVKSGLMIVDQHRADLRIRYEQYLDQLANHTASTQRLLFPEVLRLAPSEQPVMEAILPTLRQVGFDLTDLGGGSYAIAGLPAGLDGLAPATLVTTLISDAANAQSSTPNAEIRNLNSQLALSLSRAAAIPQGQVLQNEEMESIINRLFACQNVNYTPDGRAILCILPQTDIEQMLG